METRLGQLAAVQHRCVEPVHHSAWPVQKPRPFHEVLETSNLRRGEDRVEFSDELRRLNAENRLRDLRCDEAAPPADIEQTGEPAPAAGRPEPMPEASTEHVTVAEHRYEVTHRSTTGRLIDMLM